MRPPLPGAPLALGLIGVLSLGGVMIGALPLPFAEARQPSTEVALRSHTIERDGTPLRIEYCGNGPLRPDTDVRRLLIMIHGTGGDACGYAAVGVEAAQLAGELHDTLVVVPRFITHDDPAAEHEPDRLYWTTGGWKPGANSRDTPHARPWRMSSFAVVDDLVRTSAAVLPNLEDTVIAGHSAGGQFANRYAASTRVAGDARFVVANPSSYLYLDARRFDGNRFVVPHEEILDACPDYDTYRYGMNGLYAYLRAVGPERLHAQFGDREVAYLLGENDNNPAATALDTRCAARIQGEHRLERGQRYHASLAHLYDASIHDRHTLTTVPGAGHGARSTYTSPKGRAVLFGTGADEADAEPAEPAEPGGGLGRRQG
jgi:pimeloyl-ACP methyl ester carboxylesterase